MNNRTVDKVWAESMAFDQDDEFIELEIDESKLEEYNNNAKKHKKKIGSFVMFRRIQLGLEQEKLAALCGITLQDLQKLEENINDIKLSKLLVIFEVLGIEYTLFT